jgi:hypothetical protein
LELEKVKVKVKPKVAEKPTKLREMALETDAVRREKQRLEAEEDGLRVLELRSLQVDARVKAVRRTFLWILKRQAKI